MPTTLFIRPNAAVKNIGHYLHVLRDLPCTTSLALAPTGCFAVCSHVDSAFENWVFTPNSKAPITLKIVCHALEFFADAGVPFVWPILESDPVRAHDLTCTLEDAGLHRGGRLVLMNWNSANELSRRLAQVSPLSRDGAFVLEFHDVRSCNDATRWADAAWSDFGGEKTSPEEFRNFARAISERPDITLVTADSANTGENLGTFMLVNSDTETGVYYFATAPAARRRGVAAAMMAEIGRRARAALRPLVVLQATPAGVPFYDAVGFVACRSIPVYSNEREIFD